MRTRIQKITNSCTEFFDNSFCNLYKWLFCSLFILFILTVLHRQACHVDHHDRASVVRPLRRRQLGREQGLPVHHPHLQRIHHSCPLRSLPLLLRDQVSHKVSQTILYFHYMQTIAAKNWPKMKVFAFISLLLYSGSIPVILFEFFLLVK